MTGEWCQTLPNDSVGAEAASAGDNNAKCIGLYLRHNESRLVKCPSTKEEPEPESDQQSLIATAARATVILCCLCVQSEPIDALQRSQCVNM